MSKNKEIERDWTQEYEAVMNDKAVTNIAGWTEPNNDTECDEEQYRARLDKNGPILNEKLREALRFD